MARRIGIDLGTTFSLASFINAGGKPELIPNEEGTFLTPSVVWAKDGTVAVGELALNMALAEPDYLAVQMKRNMGDDAYAFHGLTAIDAAAHVLAKLKRDAESFFRGDVVDGAAITVPAYFTDAPLKATKQAGERAGLEVVALPKEPTAAALYYGTAQMKDGERLLVCDLGGGTMDATVLAYSSSSGQAEFTVLSSDGSRDLGGEDWTAALVEMVAPQFEAHFGVAVHSDARIGQTLGDACERAKRALSIQDTAKVVLALQGKTVAIPVRREEFEAATAGLLEQAMVKVQSAVGKAGLGWAGLSRVLLVGGATRMTMVGRALNARAGFAPLAWGNSDQLVALGAALFTARRVTASGGIELTVGSSPGGLMRREGGAASLVITLKESTTHGLGTLVVDTSGSRRRLVSSMIIKPHSEIPVECDRDDYQTRPQQTEVDVPVVQTDGDAMPAEACVINKTYRFFGVPKRSRASTIRVTFSYDKDNLIDVNATDVASGASLEKRLVDFALGAVAVDEVDIVLVLDTSGSMSGDPLDELKRQVIAVCKALKEHPCRVGVVQFGYETGVVCALTDDLDRIGGSVRALNAGGGTPMAEGLRATADLLRAGEARRIAILVSDGVPNSAPNARAAAQDLKRMEVTLNTISIGRADGGFLQSIGDTYTQIQSVGDLSRAIGNLLWSRV